MTRKRFRLRPPPKPWICPHCQTELTPELLVDCWCHDDLWECPVCREEVKKKDWRDR